MSEDYTSDINEFIKKCKRNNVSSLDLTLACRVCSANNRVAMFTWLFSATNNRSIKHFDHGASCWFEDGYQYPSDEFYGLDFTYVNAEKRSQFDAVAAFLSNMYVLEKNGIEIGSIGGTGISEIMEWWQLVADCMHDSEKKKKYEAMHKHIPRTREIKP